MWEKIHKSNTNITKTLSGNQNHLLIFCSTVGWLLSVNKPFRSNRVPKWNARQQTLSNGFVFRQKTWAKFLMSITISVWDLSLGLLYLFIVKYYFVCYYSQTVLWIGFKTQHILHIICSKQSIVTQFRVSSLISLLRIAAKIRRSLRRVRKNTFTYSAIKSSSEVKSCFIE